MSRRPSTESEWDVIEDLDDQTHDTPTPEPTSFIPSPPPDVSALFSPELSTSEAYLAAVEFSEDHIYEPSELSESTPEEDWEDEPGAGMDRAEHNYEMACKVFQDLADVPRAQFLGRLNKIITSTLFEALALFLMIVVLQGVVFYEGTRNSRLKQLEGTIESLHREITSVRHSSLQYTDVSFDAMQKNHSAYQTRDVTKFDQLEKDVDLLYNIVYALEEDVVDSHERHDSHQSKVNITGTFVGPPPEPQVSKTTRRLEKLAQKIDEWIITISQLDRRVYTIESDRRDAEKATTKVRDELDYISDQQWELGSALGEVERNVTRMQDKQFDYWVELHSALEASARLVEDAQKQQRLVDSGAAQQIGALWSNVHGLMEEVHENYSQIQVLSEEMKVPTPAPSSRTGFTFPEYVRHDYYDVPEADDSATCPAQGTCPADDAIITEVEPPLTPRAVVPEVPDGLFFPTLAEFEQRRHGNPTRSHFHQEFSPNHASPEHLWALEHPHHSNCEWNPHHQPFSTSPTMSPAGPKHPHLSNCEWNPRHQPLLRDDARPEPEEEGFTWIGDYDGQCDMGNNWPAVIVGINNPNRTANKAAQNYDTEPVTLFEMPPVHTPGLCITADGVLESDLLRCGCDWANTYVYQNTTYPLANKMCRDGKWEPFVYGGLSFISM